MHPSVTNVITWFFYNSYTNKAQRRREEKRERVAVLIEEGMVAVLVEEGMVAALVGGEGTVAALVGGGG